MNYRVLQGPELGGPPPEGSGNSSHTQPKQQCAEIHPVVGLRMKKADRVQLLKAGFTGNQPDKHKKKESICGDEFLFRNEESLGNPYSLMKRAVFKPSGVVTCKI